MPNNAVECTTNSVVTISGVSIERELIQSWEHNCALKIDEESQTCPANGANATCNTPNIKEHHIAR